MKPKTEEFLNFMLWSAELLMRPTFRNLTDSYESWSYRHGFDRQLETVERRQLLERDPQRHERVYRLTEEGRLHALGGRDPLQRWTRRWDKRWRIALFDVPMTRNEHRLRLRRYLRAKGFGCLQGSVWITPDPVDDERQILAGSEVNVRSLLFMEARACTGETDSQIVAGAWDFESINERFARHLEILDRCPKGRLRNREAATTLQQWASQEREAWLDALTIDPLLPEQLLPPGYLGRKVWVRRVDVLGAAGRRLRTFQS